MRERVFRKTKREISETKYVLNITGCSWEVTTVLQLHSTQANKENIFIQVDVLMKSQPTTLIIILITCKCCSKNHCIKNEGIDSIILLLYYPCVVKVLLGFHCSVVIIVNSPSHRPLTSWHFPPRSRRSCFERLFWLFDLSLAVQCFCDLWSYWSEILTDVSGKWAELKCFFVLCYLCIL